MARKKIDPLEGIPDVDREAANTIRGFVRQFGRCIILSCAAAFSSETDIAGRLADVDDAWDSLATDIILFAMKED